MFASKTTLFATGAALIAAVLTIPSAASAQTGGVTNRVGQAQAAAQAPATGNIVETALAAGQFKTLATLLTQADLVSALSGKGPFTVFAPTDAAFAKVPKETLAALAADPELLKKVLLYHVAAGSVDAATVTKLDSVKTLAGPVVAIKVVDGKVKVGDATVTTADVKTSNGIIHIIDTVLIPPAEAAPKAAAAPADTTTMTVAQIAAGNPDFSTLVGLLVAADLVEALNGDGPFTVFAPTNAAFAKVPAATLATLSADKAKLKNVLLYHVLPANVPSSAITETTPAKTLEGQTVTVSLHGDRLHVNNAVVIAADIKASNGVIHVVDTVLIPGAAPAKSTY